MRTLQNPQPPTTDIVRGSLREYVDDFIRALRELLTHPDPKIRLEAIREGFDRMSGRPAISTADTSTAAPDLSKLYIEAVRQAGDKNHEGTSRVHALQPIENTGKKAPVKNRNKDS